MSVQVRDSGERKWEKWRDLGYVLEAALAGLDAGPPAAERDREKPGLTQSCGQSHRLAGL